MTHANNKKDDLKVYKSNLKKVAVESTLTSIGAGFSAATITVFWNSIGMNQTQIGIVQMVFTIAILLLDIPMGYVADRFSRKVLNIIGDVGVAISFIVYAISNNMYTVMLSECLLGLFMAMTNGVDNSFVKYNCNKIDPSETLLKKVNIKLNTARYVTLLITVAIGGFVAKYSLRATIGLSFIPYFIGAIVVFGIKDFEKEEEEDDEELDGMFDVIKEIVGDSKSRAYLISYVLGQEVTHGQVFLFTPLLMMVGVPIEIVSVAWAVNSIMNAIGSKISEKMINLKTSKVFAIAFIIEFLWIGIIAIKLNIVTVWLFALNGFVHGIVGGNLTTPLQNSTRDKIQTSVMSVASTCKRLLYIPVVYLANYLGNIKLQLGLVGIVIVFLPLSFVTYLLLKKVEKGEEVKQLPAYVGDGAEYDS